MPAETAPRSDEIVVGLTRPLPGFAELVEGAPAPARWRLVVGDDDTASAVARLAVASEVLVVHGETIDAPLLDTATGLRLIIKCGAGLDAIDQPACAHRGIAVRSCPDAVTTSAAELALGLMLSAARRIPFAAKSSALGITEAEAGGLLELSGKRLGVLGYGRIGRAVGALAQAFGMEVSFSDPTQPIGAVVDGAASVGLPELFATADVVSLHVPGGPATRGLVGDDLLGLLRPGSLLVNVSRGSVVDQGALLRALDAGRVRCAALDVLDEEDEPGIQALRAHPNVVITPHMAGSTADSRRKLAHACWEHLRSYTARRDAAAAEPSR